VIECHLDPLSVVDVDAREAAMLRAVPDRDNWDVHGFEVGEQLRLVSHVAGDHDRIALPRLQNRRQRQRLVRPLAGVTEDDAVAALACLVRQRLDPRSEERVGHVAHDCAEQHRRRSAQASSVRVGAVRELDRGCQHPLARLLRDRHHEGRPIEDPRHRAL
jgi:hypothetical protein